jgi:hypothetical protein
MANNTFTIKVNVQDGGDVAKVKKSLEALGATVESTTRRSGAASKANKDLFDTQNKGIIGTANSTRSFSKLAQTIGTTGSSGLVGAYATLAANIFAVSAAFNALRGAAQVDQIFKGLEASGNRVGRSLTVAAKGLVEVTNNAISMEQALRSTAQISSAGFGSDAIVRLGQAARDTSFALGRNMTDSLDRLTKGVVKLEPELLDELGIMTKLTESNSNYANQLGKSESQLTNYEKRQGFLNAVLTEAELKFGGLSASAGDSTNYDKLSATLSNLSNTVLNVFNVVLAPLTGLLASSMVSLAGVGVLFASTLKNQLAPGLLNSAAAAKKAAVAYSESATAKVEAAEAARTLAKAEQAQTLAQQANFNNLTGKAPKIYGQFADSIRNGTASVAEQEKALSSLSRSYDANQRILDNHVNYQDAPGGNPKRDAKIADNQNILREIEAIQNLDKARRDSAQFDVENNKNVQNAVREAAIARQYAATSAASADALTNASQFKVLDTITSIRTATTEYAKGLQAAGETGTLAFAKVRTAAFGASLAIKSIGVALLNAIPIIGQVLFAVGLISTALEALKSDYTKKLEKAFADFTEVAGGMDEKIAELNRTLASTGPQALRASQAIRIQSNAIAELVESYLKITQAQATAEKENTKYSGGVAGLFDLLTGNQRANRSYYTGLRQDSQVLDTVQDRFTGLSFITGKADKAVLGAARTLGELAQVAPKATEKLVKMNGGFEGLRKMSDQKYVETITKIATNIRDRFGPAAQQVEELTQSLKSANDSIGEFLVSSADKTSYDTVVQNLQSVTKSIVALQTAQAQGSNEGNWTQVLTGLGANVGKFLDVNTAKLIEQTNQVDAIVQSYKALGTAITSSQKDDLALQEKNLAGLRARTGEIVLGIQKAQELFEINQHDERVIKSQITLLNARMAANEANYTATAKGVAARVDGENNLKDLQAKQLVNQKALIEAQIAQSQAKLLELRTQDALNKALGSQNQQELIISRTVAQRRKDAYDDFLLSNKAGNTGQMIRDKQNVNAIRQVGGDQAAKNAETYYATLKNIEDLDAALARKADESGLEQQIRAQTDAAKALSDQISAIYESKLTADQKAAAVAAKQAEVQNARLNTLTGQRAKLEDVNDIYRETESIISGTNDSLKTQIDLIKRTADRQTTAAKDAYNQNLTVLRANLQSAKADASKAGTDGEKAASRERIRYAQDELTLAEQGLSIDLQAIDAATQRSIAEKAIFDTRKEGLEYQQSALDYVQKELETSKALSDETQRNFELRTRLAAKRANREVSAETEEAITIRAASEAYKLAVQEVAIKKGLIDLQYALLDAQKEQLEEDLRSRRDNLKADDPRNDTRIAQLNASLDRLENVDLSKASNSAKRAIDVALENSRLELDTAMTRAVRTGPFAEMVSSIKGIQDVRKARRIGEDALRSEAPKKLEGIVRGDSLATKAAMQPEVPPLVKSNSSLMAKIDEWIHSIQGMMKVQTTSASAGEVSATANATVKQIIAYFTSKGYTVNQAAGIAGNFQHESGLDPHKREGGGGPGVGLAQFSKANQAEFLKQFGHGVMESTVEEQLKFINSQLNGTEGAAKRLLLAATSVEEATIAFSKGYERPKRELAHDDRRIAYAKAALKPEVLQAAQPAKPAVVAPKEEPANDNNTINGPDITVQARRGIETPDSINKMRAESFAPVQAPTIDLPDYSGATDALAEYDALTKGVIANLMTLGPDGEYVAAVASGFSTISSSSIEMLRTLETTSGSTAEGFADRFTAIASVASAAVSTIQSALAASASSKEEAVQREIDIETKRDGKSAESVQKIAALEKKKDQIAKAQFNTNKKLMMAQAVIATATGVAQALSYGPVAGPILAGLIGALGAAQIAIIAGTQYQSTASNAASVASIPSISIGKVGDSVDVAKTNKNVGGELGYLRGNAGTGSTSANYATIGSAYGGKLGRGYGNAAFVVGEKGPETLTPETVLTVNPANDNSQSGRAVNAEININAIDAKGVHQVLRDQRGNIISMLREAANAEGQRFMEDVNVAEQSRPSVGRLL